MPDLSAFPTKEWPVRHTITAIHQPDGRVGRTQPTPAPDNRWLPAVLAACAVALAACGGGGGSSGSGDTSVQPPAPVLVDPALAMQGFWSGSVTAAPDGATRSSAIVMPDGTGWIVFESDVAPTAVAKLALAGTAVTATQATVAGSGAYYRLGNAAPSVATGARIAATESGTASTNGTFTGTVTVSGNAATSFNWASVAGFTTPSIAADVVGTWNGTLGGGATRVSWGINATGAVAGNSSTGCSYAGTLRPSTGTAVYDMAVAEDCSGVVRNLGGIAILAANKTSLRVVFTAEAGASGGLMALNRQ